MSFLRLMEEMISEIEQPVSPEVPIVHQHKKQTPAGLLRDMWPAYLIEIFVIILGISITLGLEAWRESVKEKKLAHVYLQNLQTDISMDLKAIRNARAETEKLLRNGDSLLNFIDHQGSGNITAPELVDGVRSVLGRPDFRSHDVTFSELKSSGNLHLMENPEFKNLLFSYYGQTQNIQSLQDAELQATIALSGPFFMKNFPLENFTNLKSDSVSVFAAAKTTEFHNNVLLRVSNRKELLENYVTADSTAQLLKKILTSE